MLEECRNGVRGQVFNELVRGPTSKSKWKTAASGGKDWRRIGHSTRHNSYEQDGKNWRGVRRDRSTTGG